ncbi:MAG: efflux transporter periplasmic adaptor subunit [Phenylobacterium sp.]|nr:efflux transporter periplasmic adaptor subunit [Phenylobacterium sp.]
MTARRRLQLALGALMLVAVGLVAWVLLHRKPAAAAAPPPIPVTAAKAVAQDMPITVTELGSALAWTSVTIFAQASGKLIRVNFVEGSDVKAGQLLAEVDPAPYRAALTQAEGTLQRDESLLAGARRDLARYQRLFAQNAVARQILEDEVATVGQFEGTVRLDQGLVAAARINLAYCRIVSPISGRAGVRLVDPGNLVSASGSVASTPSTASVTSSASPTATTSSTGSTGSGAVSSASSSAGGTGIVVINQIQPIAVTFTVGEGEFQRLQALSNGFTRPLPAQAYSQETGELVDSGQVTIADNQVDAASGTVELKGRFPNPGRRLWPGQFVNVRLTRQILQNVIVVPSSAVNRGPNGLFAFVVGPNNQVVLRPVAIFATEGAATVLKSGVRAGEMVVTDGQMTLKNKSKIRVTQVVPIPKATP